MPESRQPSKPEMTAARASSVIIPPYTPTLPTPPIAASSPVPEQPKPDPTKPIWAAMEGISSMVVALIAVCTAIGGGFVMHYRLVELEGWRVAHEAQSNVQRAQRDASISQLKDSVADLRLSTTTDITRLKGSFESIQASLADLQKTIHDLDSKVDKIADRGGR